MRKAFVLALTACAAFAQTPNGERGPTGDAALENRAAVIGPEDTITISALDADEISKAWRVGTNGEINLPMIGPIQVAGMTVEQFEEVLTRRMRKYYRNPQVSAFISEFRSEPVTVTGPVEKPGTYQLQGPKTLFDVVVMAGGPKDTAGRTITLTRAVGRDPIAYPGARRDETGKYQVIELPTKDVMDGRSAAALIPVEAYDVVAVADFKQPKMVTVAGEVTKPGAVELVTQDTISLVKVVALAGGLTRTASAKKTMIVHLNEQGVQTSTAYIDLKKIMSGKARDIELTAGDVIIVPSSSLMTYLQTASLSAVTTGVYVLGRF